MADHEPLKVLLLGGSGQVGMQWRHLLTQNTTPPCVLRSPSRQELDLIHLDAVRDDALQFRPDLIVNAAAFTAVDRAETEPELAHALNAALPTVLAQAAHELGAALLHYSTDYVFDGTGLQAHGEDDPVHPLSVYGKTKALGEAGIREHLTRYLILRTSWVMGAQGGNFLKTMLRQAAERESLRVVADQFGVPTPARLLAQLGWLAWQHCVRMESSTDLTPPWGLYHVAPRGETTWYDYARFMLSEALIRGWCLKAGPSRITPVPAADYPSLAQRPTNSRLDVSRFEQAFNLVLPPWQDGVRDTLDELRSVAA